MDFIVRAGVFVLFGLYYLCTEGRERMEENWKIIRNRACIRAIMIFMGVVLMQMLAYMVCMIVLLSETMLFDVHNSEAVERLARANTQDGDFLMVVSLVSAVLSMVWCGILYKKSSWREKSFDYKKAFCGKNIMAIIGCGVGGCIVITIVLTVISMIIPQAFTSYNVMMERLTDNSVIFSVLYVVLIGPLSEEFIFRGAILDRFYLAFPFYIANALQAVLFGIYHGNLIQGLYAFCLGFMLGLLRKKTGSIISCILTHMIFNSTTFLLEKLFQNNSQQQIWLLLIVAVLGFVFLGTAVSYLWEKKKTDLEE